MEELYLYTQRVQEIKDTTDRSLEAFNAVSYSIEILDELSHRDDEAFNNSSVYNKSEEYLTEIYEMVTLKPSSDIIKYEQLLAEKEEEIMKKNAINKMKSKQIEFLLISSVTSILGLLGMILFYITGIYIIHPMIYLVIFIMGIGWLCTAITSIYVTRNHKERLQ